MSKEENSVALAVVGGLTPGAKLRENRMIEFGPTGIKFTGKPSFEQWSDLMKAWKQMKTAWHMGLSDLIAFGNAEFGEDKVKEVLAQNEFDFADEMQALAIGQIPLELRVETLSEEHYYMLGKAFPGDENKKDREKWMAIAVKEKLTAYELQKSIEAGKVVKGDSLRDQQGRGSGINTIQGLGFWFDKWQAKVGGDEKIFAMSRDNKMALLAELAKPGELYLKLKSQLEQVA